MESFLFERIKDSEKNVGRYCTVADFDGIYVVKQYLRRVDDGQRLYELKHISKGITIFVARSEISEFLQTSPTALSDGRGGPRRWK
jgi:hypothetical protein